MKWCIVHLDYFFLVPFLRRNDFHAPSFLYKRCRVATTLLSYTLIRVPNAKSFRKQLTTVYHEIKLFILKAARKLRNYTHCKVRNAKVNSKYQASADLNFPIFAACLFKFRIEWEESEVLVVANGRNGCSFCSICMT